MLDYLTPSVVENEDQVDQEWREEGTGFQYRLGR